MSVVNKYKVLEIRWNTSRAMKRHQYTEHRRMGRADRTPFGYAPDPADPRLLVSVPEEQKAIAIIRAKAASGLGARRIAKYLDEHGINRRGKTWTSCHCLVGTILKRLEAAGK